MDKLCACFPVAPARSLPFPITYLTLRTELYELDHLVEPSITSIIGYVRGKDGESVGPASLTGILLGTPTYSPSFFGAILLYSLALVALLFHSTHC